jgi:hypothetical protein
MIIHDASPPGMTLVCRLAGEKSQAPQRLRMRKKALSEASNKPAFCLKQGFDEPLTQW